MPNQIPPQFFFGGDYNPEQWSREVWQEDVRLMREANVNLVSLGIFSWANLEVADGVYQFDWLDEIINLLHDNGIGVDLATATASPPAWLTRQHPEILPQTASGVIQNHGGRQNYCISSPVYKAKAVALVSKLAERYANHPAIKMWHVNNEYGCHNPRCFCDISADAWRVWLQQKYSNLDALNKAWGTDFWSQRYHEWDQILPPRETPAGTYPNPSMVLDFHRFSNEQILDLFKAERDEIRKHDSAHPITTNFMSLRHAWLIDYWMWAKEVDFVSTDHYLIAQDPENYIDLAFQADLTRGFAAGKPWLLMEHSTGAVNWQEHNLPKANGEMIANSISHIARGSNGAMFFQWRQSVSGSEKFHSAMVPHAGANTRIWRDVVKLGGHVSELSNLGSSATEQADVAMVFDYDSWWAMSQRNLPSTSQEYWKLPFDWYRALWQLGIRVDFVSPDATAADLAKYKAVLMPNVYLLSDEQEQQFMNYSSDGGSLFVSYFTGISDRTDTVKLGGYGGRLVRETLGVQVSEFAPLNNNVVVHLDSGLKAFEWAQFATARDGSAVSRFTDGIATGELAISKTAGVPNWYVGTRLDEDSCKQFFSNAMHELGIDRAGGDGVEVIRRGGLRFEIDNIHKTVSWR